MSEEIDMCCDNELPFPTTPCPCGCHYWMSGEQRKAQKAYDRDWNKVYRRLSKNG